MRTLLTAKDFTPRPWKNGRGTTLELLKWPSGSGDDFVFRFSRADLTESGPFSLFPGIDRVLVITEGPAVTLNMSSTHELPLWKPFAFRGEENVEAILAGPGKDFNLMLDREKVEGTVQVARGKKTFRSDAKFFAVLTYSPLELLFIEGEPDTDTTVDNEDNYLVIRVNEKKGTI